MNSLSVHTKMFIGALLFMCATLFCASAYMHAVESSYVNAMKLKIAAQEGKLASISLLIDHDQADPVVESIIPDCSLENRQKFDELLGKLASLRGKDLVEMEQLFNACGDFYAQRRAVMVARLEREYEIYVDLIGVLAVVNPKAKVTEYDIKGWRDLLSLEATQSELSTKLVNLQGKIIQALNQNVSISSDAMQSMLVAGQATKDSLLDISKQIEAQRQTLKL